MSSSPASASDKSRRGPYVLAWSAIMDLVRKGHSWSGKERHCCFLNEGGGRFANISYLSGLDAVDDGRAIAVTDWDQDGDLDLWFRNRTAPRLRLKLNRHRPGPGDRDGDGGGGGGEGTFHDHVGIQLVGTVANRDGVGAVVEVVLENFGDGRAGHRRLVKSVRAGDLFLSQSSKWLHFGLGAGDRIREVVVLWPGGRRESFQGVRPGRRHLLTQGSGTAETLPARDVSTVLPGSSHGAGTGSLSLPDQTGSAARVLLPSAVPLPAVYFRDPAGRPRSLAGLERVDGGRLLVVWSVSCPHCRAELSALAGRAAELRAAGIDVLALSVDGFGPGGGVADSSPAYNLMDELRFPFRWGLIDAPSLDRVQQVQVALFDRTVPFSVPLGFLLDAAGNAVSLYRGPQSLDDVLEDARALVAAGPEERMHLAPPLAGRWFTKPLGPGQVAELMAREFDTRHPEQALDYLLRAEVLAATAGDRARLAPDLSRQHRLVARRCLGRGEPEGAASHFEAALRGAPEPAQVHHEYASMLGRYGLLDRAEEHFRRALAIDPELAGAREGLARVEALRAEVEAEAEVGEE